MNETVAIEVYLRYGMLFGKMLASALLRNISIEPKNWLAIFPKSEYGSSRVRGHARPRAKSSPVASNIMYLSMLCGLW